MWLADVLQINKLGIPESKGKIMLMYDAFTSPPMPEWSGLTDADRHNIKNEWRSNFCPCCGVSGSASRFYEYVRKILKSREKRVFKATMNGPSLGTSGGRDLDQ